MHKPVQPCPEWTCTERSRSSRRGFTLIELLVVISIIAILSVIGVVVFVGAQKNARDAKKRADIQAVYLALQQNYNLHGAYTQPENMAFDNSIGCQLDHAESCSINNADWDPNSDLRDLVTDGFMRELPKDPLNNWSYYYWYEPGNEGQHFQLCANKLEGTNTAFCMNNQ